MPKIAVDLGILRLDLLAYGLTTLQKKEVSYMRGMMRAHLFLFTLLVTSQAGAQTDKYQCKVACDPNKVTAYCLIAPKDQRLAPAFRNLRDKFASSNNPLLASSLLTWFGLTTDPCRRSDTTFSSGVWTNTGDACLLGTQLGILPQARPVAVSLSIPSKLQFTVKNEDGVSKFIAINSMPYLQIDDINLQMDWGGTVKEITANGSAALFQLRRGCIKIPL